MPRPRLFALAVALLGAISSFAQQSPFSPPDDPQWVLLTDPARPVPFFHGSSVAPNATENIRVMYFPKASRAKVKDPQALTLYAAFDGPHFANNQAVIPFTRKGDHWESVVPTEGHLYALLYVKDERTNIADDNAGNLWDVVFCDADGERSASSLMRQAETYTGNGWPEKIHREKDYAKAVSVMQSAAAGKGWERFSEILVQLWHYEVLRDGNDSDAWTKVAKEIEQSSPITRKTRPQRIRQGRSSSDMRTACPSSS